MPKKKKMQHPFLNEANKGKGKKSQQEPELTEADKNALAFAGVNVPYKCEECGEYHEFHELEDEYEFGAHDEYELTVGGKKKRKSKEPVQIQTKKCPRGEVIPRTDTCPLPEPPIPPPPPNYTSEPIPDYIMRALQPKKSEHPKYGKLRY